MKKKFVIHMTPYKHTLNCFIGYSGEEIVKYLQEKCNFRLNEDEIYTISKFKNNRTNSGRLVESDGLFILAISKDYTYGVIAHEMLHTIDLLWQRIGLDNALDKECTNYLLEYLVDEFYKKSK